jgi:hypothetical protein
VESAPEGATDAGLAGAVESTAGIGAGIAVFVDAGVLESLAKTGAGAVSGELVAPGNTPVVTTRLG